MLSCQVNVPLQLCVVSLPLTVTTTDTVEHTKREEKCVFDIIFVSHLRNEQDYFHVARMKRIPYPY